jgi:hypothetical protein
VKYIRDGFIADQFIDVLETLSRGQMPGHIPFMKTMMMVAANTSALNVLEKKFGMNVDDAFRFLFSPPSKEIIQRLERKLKKYVTDPKGLLQNSSIMLFFTDPDQIMIRHLESDADREKEMMKTYTVIFEGFGNTSPLRQLLWKDDKNENNKSEKGFWSKTLEQLKDWAVPPLVGTLIGGSVGGLSGSLAGSFREGRLESILDKPQYAIYPALFGGSIGAGLGFLDSGLWNMLEDRKYTKGITKLLLASLPITLTFLLPDYLRRNKKLESKPTPDTGDNQQSYEEFI